MDEIEMKRTYQLAVDAAVGVQDENAKRCLLLVLQMFNSMIDMIAEMQFEEDC